MVFSFNIEEVQAAFSLVMYMTGGSVPEAGVALSLEL